jgi:hypothetical protein
MSNQIVHKRISLPIILHFNSEFRTNIYDDTSVAHFLLTQSIILGNNEFMTLKILNLTLPNSLYIINKRNNQFFLYQDNVPYLITLPIQNLTVNDLAGIIETELNNISGIGFNKYTVSYNYNLNKLNFKVENLNGDYVSCALAFGGLYNIANQIIGLNETDVFYFTTNNLTGKNTYNMVDLSGDHSVYLASNLNSLNIYDSSIGAYNRRLLCEIPLTQQNYNIIFYKNDNELRLTDSQIPSDIKFEIIDKKLRSLSLNGINWSLTVELNFYLQDLQEELTFNDAISIENQLLMQQISQPQQQQQQQQSNTDQQQQQQQETPEIYDSLTDAIYNTNSELEKIQEYNTAPFVYLNE